MRTEELIQNLAAQTGAVGSQTVERRAIAGLGLGFAVTLLLFLILLGPRPDLAQALSSPLVAAKTLLPLLLGPAALALALRAARPAAGAPPISRAIWLLPVAAVLLFVLAFVTTPSGARLAGFIGHSIPVCLPSIVLLSAAPAAFLFRALRHGAPTRPARCGALAGLAAAGFATALYSTFCTEDTPLFYAVWYSVGIGIVTLAGAVAGARFLRW